MLKKDHYKVLDEDAMLKTYYVLAPESKQVVGESTPIYRVSISAVDDHSILTLKDQQNHSVHTQLAEHVFDDISRDLT